MQMGKSESSRSFDPLSLHTSYLNQWRWQRRPAVVGGATTTGGQMIRLTMENVDLVRFPYFVGFAWLPVVGVLYLEKKFVGFG
jgi:hypothetical protein